LGIPVLEESNAQTALKYCIKNGKILIKTDMKENYNNPIKIVSIIHKVIAIIQMKIRNFLKTQTTKINLTIKENVSREDQLLEM
jgi:hypothetical protein